MDVWITAVSTVGFPIVSFLISAWFIKYTYDKSTEQNEKALERIGTLAEAVNNNTEVLAELVKKIEN